MRFLDHFPCGVASYTQMIDVGVTRAAIRRGVREGQLRSVRHNWYAVDCADPTVVEAVASGGVASCLTALRFHGVWVPLHKKVIHARAIESMHRAHKNNCFCVQFGRPEREVGAIDDVPTALRHAVKCLDNDEDIVVVCDSILNKGLLTMCDLERELASAPRRIRRLLARCDGKAQSGPETMMRLRLRAKGIKVRTQVFIDGIGYVDLLVGNRLIIELDSIEFHDKSEEQCERDRVRDEIAERLGYHRPLRFSCNRVMYQWAEVEETIDVVIGRREHLKKLSPVRPRKPRKSGSGTRAT